MTDKTNRRCVTPPFRMAYPSLFKMEEYQGKETYGMEAVFPPDADLSELKKIAGMVRKDKWGEKPPKTVKSPFINGDRYNEEHDNHRAELEGATFLRLRTTNKPEIVDIKLREVTDQIQVYSGRWARASVYCHAYEGDMSKGVTFLLNNVQLLQDDEPWGAPRASAHDDFDDEMSQKSEAQDDFSSDDEWG